MPKNKKRCYQEEYIQYGFSYIVKDGTELPQCVICHKVLANDSMKPFQLKQHLEKLHPRLAQKDRTCFKLKSDGLKRLRLDGSGIIQHNSKATTHASYVIALHIAKNKKAHTIGETLIKPCILDSAKLVLNDDSVNKLKQIPLSNNTIKSRIQDMAHNINQAIAKIKSSKYFAIQLDETTDIANLSQLLVFARYVDGQDIKDDFLFCRPLTRTTKGEDVMELISTFFDEKGLLWKDVIGVCTDGAPAMLGSRSGFLGLVKRKNPTVVGVHCMIHREALASKTLPAAMHAHLEIIIKTVNFIKGSALNTRLFRELCENMDAEHQALLFHTQVRWLSKGNMLARFYELSAEVKTFLVNQNKEELLTKINMPDFQAHLAYLADIFEVLNELNRKLQGRESSIIHHADNIKAFIAKLQLWGRRIQDGNVMQFHRLTEVIGDDDVNQVLKAEIAEHLNSLIDEFQRYFPDINTDQVTMALTRDPFKCHVDDVPTELQEEFLELKHNSSAKDEFTFQSLNEFWVKMCPIYPGLSNNALRVLIPFSSTYLCESGFSSLMSIKSKARNKLQVECDLRCALSLTATQIAELVANKQVQGSH